MFVRGIRGATTVEENTPAAILEATKELLTAMVAANRVEPSAIAAAFFTATPDLDAEFPAAAAHCLGWDLVPLMGAQEMAKPGGLPKCIRVMLLVNTPCRQEEVRHIYLKGAQSLRPDWAAKSME